MSTNTTPQPQTADDRDQTANHDYEREAPPTARERSTLLALLRTYNYVNKPD